MFKIVQSSFLAVIVATTGVGSVTFANAQDVELRLGPDGIRPVIRDRDRRDVRSRGCSEREARAAARDAGLRDPEVVRTTRSRVVVEGETRRGLRDITFANERGCPEL